MLEAIAFFMIYESSYNITVAEVAWWCVHCRRRPFAGSMFQHVLLLPYRASGLAIVVWVRKLNFSVGRGRGQTTVSGWQNGCNRWEGCLCPSEGHGASPGQLHCPQEFEHRPLLEVFRVGRFCPRFVLAYSIGNSLQPSWV